MEQRETGLFTFYAHMGMHGAKIAVPPSLNHLPHDWAELKEHLLDRARKAYFNYGVLETLWSFEKHVSSKIKVYRPTIRSYRPRAFYWARNALAYFVVEYVESSDSINVKQALFSPTISNIAREYREIEKGEKFVVKPVVPKSFQTFIENPQAVLQETSALRYADYSKTSRLKYDRTPRTLHSSPGVYVPFGQKLKESR